MREAARVLDDVSDHLGEVLRRSDELLAEWSRFGAQVRAEVDREATAIGAVIDGAVARAASEGLDRAIADRLRALTTEIDRLEQRTRAAARAVSEHRDADRRVLWIAVAGIVLANALLVALLLRKPEAAPIAEPVRIESPAAPQLSPGPIPAAAPRGSTDPTSAPAAAGAAGTVDLTAPGTGAGSSGLGATGSAGSNAAGAGSGSAGSNAAGAGPGSAALGGPAKPAAKDSLAKPPEMAGAAKAPPASVIPPRGAAPRPHKKLP